MTTSAIGWALISEAGRLPTERLSGDPLTRTLEQVPIGGHVDLIAYTDAASFAQSQAARDGMTRDEHVALLAKLKGQLIQHGRSASIKWVSVEK